MCRLGEIDHLDECNFDNRRFSHYKRTSNNYVFNIMTCEPLCKSYNCPQNCESLRNKQITSHIIRVVKSITSTQIAAINRKFNNLSSAVHIRDYLLNRLDNILPVIGIYNFHLRVLYKGLNIQILAEFRSHKLSPNFSFVNIYVAKLKKVKSLQKLAAIEVAHRCKNDTFNLDRLFNRGLIHYKLWEQIQKYFDIKQPSCPFHPPYTYHAECQFCHIVTFHHKPDLIFTKHVVGNSLPYHKPGTDGYLAYTCVNPEN